LLSAPDRAAEPFAAYSHATVRQPRVRVRAHTLDDGVLSEWVFRRCEHVHDDNGTDKGIGRVRMTNDTGTNNDDNK
jgi:hypothetical protein